MGIVYVPVTDLHPFEGNVQAAETMRRDISRMITCSEDPKETWERLREAGITNPVLAMRDGTILSGTRVWVLAGILRMEKVPTIYIDTSDPVGFMIGLNKVG